MTSEFVQEQVRSLLAEATEAIRQSDWNLARERARDVLAFDPENADAKALLTAAARRLGDEEAAASPGSAAAITPEPTSTLQPTSFAGGRYEVKRFLGEGGKKRVYLAHDSQLDRDVAFALVKTEGLDDAARQRITREAQAMGRLGSHPHIVTVYDIGHEGDQPYLVLPVLPGGDVEGVIEDAEDHKLSIEQAVKIASEVCLGLEFSHQKGIIHRDLKPGNVWLAEDGRAMIGDFGLAVALDRSRLTQAGMMVGTVNYMPPEQAMGGEATPQSDLYSLGAMLYEMVCGRPPFVGDEHVAIIGQHLNTPPVAPSWHRPDCPPGLEVLILRLLEKDASKRPASASEVKDALSSLSSAPAAPSVHEVAATHEQDPLYRRVFVGREQEIRQLQAAFDASMSGQGGLVMIVGEPGIGKTSLVEQLSTYVQLRGGKTLLGHCYEEGSLSLPYLPFIEAMRSYVLTREPDGLRSDLGSGASEVARIVSEVRDKVNVTPSQGGDPEEQRWRLMEAVKEFLRNAGQVQPLMVVLEDLHDSDRGTLDLLVHLTRSLEGTRLLIAGTYRDVEVDRAHPLSGTLADLRRVGAFTRVPLRGLTVDEVHRLYAAVRGHEVSWQQAEAIHRQTEGNPLFIQEVLRYLVEEGLVVRQGDRYVPVEGQGPGSNIPEGLRDVIGKRLSLLSEKTNQVLSIAAVIGREFRLDALNKVSEMAEDEVIEALEEATDRAVVELRSQVGANLSYRFTHAFFRQTLYEELSPPRRIRVHQQVARALEEVYGHRMEEYAAELAEHYSYSSDQSDLAQAISFSEKAAQRAMAVFAYDEAVAHFDRALEIQEILDPNNKVKRCDLFLSLGVALQPTRQVERLNTQVAPAAYDLAMELGDRHRAFRSALLVARRYGGTGIAELVRFDEFALWTQRAAELAEPGTSDQVRSDILSAIKERQGNPLASWQLLKRAYSLARTLDDDSELVPVAGLMANAAFTPAQECIDLLEVTDDLSKRNLGSYGTLDWSFNCTNIGTVYVMSGNRGRAEQWFEQVEQAAQRTRHPEVETHAAQNRALQMTLDGRFEELLAYSDAFLESARLSNRRATQPIGRMRRKALSYLGRHEEALLTLPPPGELLATGGVMEGQRAIYLARLGKPGDASAILDRFLDLPDVRDEDGLTSATLLRYLLEAAVESRHEAMCRAVFNRMDLLRSLVICEAWMPTCIGSRLGDAAVLLGRPDQARDYYVTGLQAAEGIGFRPEIGLTRLALAELLLDHFPEEQNAAIEHLDFAIAEFHEMKMQPALERALGRRGLLKA